jgi:Uma2 family endonuclease
MTKITDLSQLDMNGVYNYADYLTWQFDETVELIKGKIALMSPAPNLKHQSISGSLFLAIGNYFRHKSCKLFSAPFDVRLYDRRKSLIANQDIYTVVQPDLCVICDSKKLDYKGCLGAPDWIIEILSKGNSKKEMHDKYQLYLQSGVKEYWLVYPYEQAIYCFILNDSEDDYRLFKMYSSEQHASPYLFPELVIDLNEVFSA